MNVVTAGSARNPVVSLSGEIDVANSVQVRSALSRLVDAGATNLTVDLTDVTFIDSSGLGVFVAIFKRLRSSREGTLRLVRPSGSVRKVFEITGLDSVFVIDDETGG